MLKDDMLPNQGADGDAVGRAAAAVCSAPRPERPLTAVAGCRGHSAFAQLLDRFAPRIQAVLRRQGAAAPLDRHATQDVMLALFSIARTRLIDAFRRGRNEHELDAQSIALPAAGDTDHRFHLTGFERHLRQAVASLPTEQNRLTAQGYFGETSRSAPGTVKPRQRLALGKLRRLLDPIR